MLRLGLFLLLLGYLSPEWGARTWGFVLGEGIVARGLLEEPPLMAVFELNNNFLPPLSFLWLMSGMSWVRKKTLWPNTLDITHPFPALSHLPSPHYSSFKDVRLPPRLWAVKSLFFPPAFPLGMEGESWTPWVSHFLVTGLWDVAVFCLLCFNKGNFKISGGFQAAPSLPRAVPEWFCCS